VNALAITLAALVRAYQLLLRPLFPPACRFEPSCSHYAIEALRTHGALRGSWLAALRVLRCNPWMAGGCDPVPCRGHHPDSLKAR
jgi:putative membrane protein insertion efficiency factor